MRTFSILLFLSFISSTTLFPQISFERTYGGYGTDYGNSVQQTTDGGFIIAGYTLNLGTYWEDVYLIKTDSSGDTLWTRAYGGELFEEGWSVQKTVDGGYIIAGRMASFFPWYSSNVYLIKMDSSGDTLWTRTYRDGEGYSVQQTSDQGYVIVGGTYFIGPEDGFVYLIKTDAVGDTLWTRTYGGEWYDVGYSIQQTTDGGYVIAGVTKSFGAGEEDIYLIKTNSSGDTLWTRTYGGAFDDTGNSVQQTTDEGFIIAGYSDNLGAGALDVYLIRTDSSGDTLWTRTYGGVFDDTGNSVQQTMDGGFVIAGVTASFGAGDTDVYLIKTDSSGDTLWTRTFGGDGHDDGKSVQQTEDGGYVITGGTRGDVYLVKTDPDGYVGISDNKFPSLELPHAWALSQNYPNPFNPTTTISFKIPSEAGKKQHVNLTIYDLRGRHVKTLVDEEYKPGTHQVVWNGKNEQGQQVSSGIYLYTLKSGDKRYTRKMVILE